MTASRRPRARSALTTVIVLLACAFAAILTVAGPGAVAISRAAQCDSTSKGFVPLIDLGTGTYIGFEGGLYPGGGNVPPAAHLAAGIDEAHAIEPLDSLGVPDPANGWIVLLSIGMCNTSQEYASFISVASGYAGRNPRVAFLNGAQGGQTAAVIANPNAQFWNVIDQRLAQQGFTAAQVQAVWFKEANASPSQAFPAHADTLRNQFLSAVRIIHSRYPNTRLCHFSSRIYAGYASTALNPEPYAYESGFAAKWLIESQIAGNDSLNFDPDSGAVAAPWLGWGPYLWADGLTPRSDGLTWLCSDFNDDGTHPSASGRSKVANLLLDFYTTDTTATPWFLASPSGTESSPPLADGFIVYPARPSPFAERTTLFFDLPEASPVRVDVVAPSGRRIKTLIEATLRPGRWDYSWDGTDSDGLRVGSGAYFLRVRGGDRVRSQRVTLLR